MTDPRPQFSLGKLPVPNGTVLIMGIGYEDGDYPGDPRGRTNPKTYTYTLLKAGGLWYVSGTGKVPQAAGWQAIEKWLSRDNRVVDWVRVATETAQLYPSPAAPEQTGIVKVLAAQVDARRRSE